MKTLSEDLAAHLESGVTTLCWCWRLSRRDGTTYGFTDHDRDVTFDGLIYEAASGLTATEARERVGLSVDNLEVSGAITSERLNETDLAGGRYDAAEIDIYRVNWAAPEQRILMRSGSLGEVTRDGRSFAAEVRGLSHDLQLPTGRLYQYTCDARLGDARCGIDLATSTYRATGVILAIADKRLFQASGLDGYAADWFTRGLLSFTGGANSGQQIEVKTHLHDDDVAWLELWRAPVGAAALGDTFEVTAGCDKRRSTCRDKFANVVNYRGFPDMPGNDRLVQRADQ